MNQPSNQPTNSSSNCQYVVLFIFKNKWHGFFTLSLASVELKHVDTSTHTVTHKHTVNIFKKMTAKQVILPNNGRIGIERFGSICLSTISYWFNNKFKRNNNNINKLLSEMTLNNQHQPMKQKWNRNISINIGEKYPPNLWNLDGPTILNMDTHTHTHPGSQTRQQCWTPLVHHCSGHSIGKKNNFDLLFFTIFLVVVDYIKLGKCFVQKTYSYTLEMKI